MILKVDLDESQFVKIHKMAQDTGSDTSDIVGGIVGLFLNKNKSNKILDNSKEKEFIETIKFAMLKLTGLHLVKNSRAKLTSYQHEDIWKMSDSGMSAKEIAKEFAVNPSTIERILKKRNK